MLPCDQGVRIQTLRMDVKFTARHTSLTTARHGVAQRGTAQRITVFGAALGRQLSRHGMGQSYFVDQRLSLHGTTRNRTHHPCCGHCPAVWGSQCLARLAAGSAASASSSCAIILSTMTSLTHGSTDAFSHSSMRSARSIARSSRALAARSSMVAARSISPSWRAHSARRPTSASLLPPTASSFAAHSSLSSAAPLSASSCVLAVSACWRAASSACCLLAD
mmetsp:Transcript_46900/g.144583  ORF Transcript_46900/g.144583 Transcript_46900/m.144583 type:complete len:221 (-) Transcript_46900:1158-1820(-)